MRLLAAALSGFTMSVLTVATAHAEQIWLSMDQVRPYTLERDAGQIVVGNPAIADVTVQDKNTLLLFGKGPGMTNLFIFDEEGETIDNLIVRVRTTQPGMLTFFRGSERTTYTCASDCDATVTVGDHQETFTGVSQQMQQKYQQAVSSGDN